MSYIDVNLSQAFRFEMAPACFRSVLQATDLEMDFPTKSFWFKNQPSRSILRRTPLEWFHQFSTCTQFFRKTALPGTSLFLSGAVQFIRFESSFFQRHSLKWGYLLRTILVAHIQIEPVFKYLFFDFSFSLPRLDREKSSSLLFH